MANPESRRGILVVDDDPGTRALLSELLTEAGYRVVTADDGADALARLRGPGVLPSLILLDILMPGMNGWQFCNEQQQDPLLAAIPVVMLSASANFAAEEPGITAAAYLTKPFDVDTLLDVVNTCSAT